MAVDPPKRTAKTGKARWICLGEHMLAIKQKEQISPSAERVLPAYLKEAKKILGTQENGTPAWEEAWDQEKGQALQVLDLRKEYDPLVMERLFREDARGSSSEGRNPFLVRDEEGEIRATNEGVRICSQKIREGLKGWISHLQNLPDFTDERYPFFVFQMLLMQGGVIYNPRAKSTLNKEQKQHVAETMRKILDAFLPYFKQSPDEVLSGFSYYFEEYITRPQGEMETIDAKPIKTLLDVSEKIPFATSPVTRYAMPSMWNHALWEDKNGMVLSYAPETKERVDITYIIARKDHQGVVQAASGEEAWAIVKNLGVETALLHVTFASSCMATEYPWSNYAKAEGDKLIKLLHLPEKKKRTPEGTRRRLTRGEQLQELRKYLHSLKAIYVLVKDLDEQGNVIEASEEPVPLWDVDIRQKGQSGVFSEDFDVVVDMNVYIRAGTWAMRETGHRGHMLYSFLYKRILDFNLLTEDWGFKWAIYTSCFMGGGWSWRFKIRTLLEAVMDPEEVKRQEDPQNRQERYGTVTKLIDQLQAMERHGWKIERGPEYQRAIGTRGGSRRPKNFFPDLLESTITLTPPDTKEKALPKGERPQQIAGTSCTPVTGAMFREQRRQLGLSQKEAGRKIGKSQGFISLVEKGERCLSPEDREVWEKTIAKYYKV